MIDEKFDPSIDELLGKLKQLEQSTQTKALRSGLVAAIKPMKADMKQDAAVDTGDLSKSIGHSTLSKTAAARLGGVGGVNLGAGVLALLVGPNRRVGGKPQAWKANLLDGGTKPHQISPRKGKALSLGGKGVARSVSHPGIEATNFMKQAYESNLSGFQGRFYEGLAKFLKKKGVSL